MRVYINPGSGPVEGATEVNADANMAQLIVDARLTAPGRYERAPAADEDDGRFAFVVSCNGRTCEVHMPGLPLEAVRYLGVEGQNIWHYPRLYVDGSSWVWKYAMTSLFDVLCGAPNDDGV